MGHRPEHSDACLCTPSAAVQDRGIVASATSTASRVETPRVTGQYVGGRHTAFRQHGNAQLQRQQGNPTGGGGMIITTTGLAQRAKQLTPPPKYATLRVLHDESATTTGCQPHAPRCAQLAADRMLAIKADWPPARESLRQASASSMPGRHHQQFLAQRHRADSKRVRRFHGYTNPQACTALCGV